MQAPDDKVMPPESLDMFVSPKKTVMALKQLWDAIRISHFNMLFHRQEARQAKNQGRAVDIASILLSGIAGIGILAGFDQQINKLVWAVFAFAAGLVSQLRPSFGLTEKWVEEVTLEEEYASVIALLQTVLDQAKANLGVTPDLHSQLQLALSRYNFLLLQRDKTEFTTKETDPIQTVVNNQFPKDRLWMPDYAQDELESQERAEAHESQQGIAPAPVPVPNTPPEKPTKA